MVIRGITNGLGEDLENLLPDEAESSSLNQEILDQAHAAI